MVSTVVLLDADFNFISSVSWKKAIKLIIKQKVEVIKESDQKIGNFVIPMIIKLFKSFSYLVGKKVKWSKSGVLDRDEYECAYCGKQLTKHNATVDHIIPSSKGGKNSWKNTVASCHKCNSEKGDKRLKEAGLSLRFQPWEPTLYDHFVSKMKRVGFDVKDIFVDI